LEKLQTSRYVAKVPYGSYTTGGMLLNRTFTMNHSSCGTAMFSTGRHCQCLGIHLIG